MDSPFWPKVVNLEDSVDNITELHQKDENISNIDHSANDDKITFNFRAHVKSVLERIISSEQTLTEMDAKVGDGDLGIGAARACKLVLAVINHLDFQNNLSQSVMKMSDVWSDGFGGSSGPLWGSFFSRAAAKLSAKLAENTEVMWIAA